MRQPEHVRDEPVVAFEIHLDVNRHRRRKQLSSVSRGIGMADVHEDDVASRKKLGVGSEHGMDGSHPGASTRERAEAAAERALERADVEQESLGRISRHLDENGVGHHQRCGGNDDIVVEIALGPRVVLSDRAAERLGVGYLDFEAL